ncbi:MAG: molybdopterin molybdotransferase MoeA [Hyphomicrobiales bacterium]
MALTPVAKARGAIIKSARTLPSENVPLKDAAGRILARDIKSKRHQPPFDASAMDGYAVRAEDVATAPATLKIIGEAPAGKAFRGIVKKGQAVRIFTGAPLPKGADTVVIQENCDRDEEFVTVNEPAQAQAYVRPRGLDFAAGEVLLEAGSRLSARQVGLAAAMNHATLPVRRRPKVALLATGDELVAPGEKLRADQIISSNNFALAPFLRGVGAEPADLGIVGDDKRALTRAIKKARGCDILVTLGGASVGDHDLVQDALTTQGMKLTFYRIAMRPGKPLMYGKLDSMHVLGLPGNPVSALVCARIFLKALIDKMLGLETDEEAPSTARLATTLPENDRRQDYLRATLAQGKDGGLVANAFPKQDSSMLRTLTSADCLIIRPPFAPAAKAGETVQILLLDF